MVDLYSPTQLVQVANAEDVQKKLNALFTSLLSRNALKIMEIIRMTMTHGVTKPTVAVTAPKIAESIPPCSMPETYPT